MRYSILATLACLFFWNGTVCGQAPSTGMSLVDVLLPIEGSNMTSDAWGGDDVRPRLVDNGLESPVNSYWGASIVKGDDGLYHMFVCGWREDAPMGHRAYNVRGDIIHAVCDKASGPYTHKEVLGRGYNPEVYQIADGRFVVYVWGGRYLGETINGPWQFEKTEFDSRTRPLLRGSSKLSLSNMTFAKRPDGSFIAVDRGGAVWVSQDGLKTWYMITDESVYSGYANVKSDPVIWHDNVQYYMMEYAYTDVAATFYRSPDGVHWREQGVVDCRKDLIRHADGTVEKWREMSRLKVVTDQYGRVEYLNMAVCDVLQSEDKGQDNHSSKQIVMPVVKPKLMEVAGTQTIDPQTAQVNILIKGEADFKPAKELDIKSLRLGSYATAGAGNGLLAIKSKKVGKADLLVTFAGQPGDLGIDADEWALKVVGRSKNGKLIYGYASMPGHTMDVAVLSAMMPNVNSDDVPESVEVENFGSTTSPVTTVKICTPDNTVLAIGTVQPMAPFSKALIPLEGKVNVPTGTTAIKMQFFVNDKMVNENSLSSDNINAFQENLVALIDSARTLYDNDSYTEGKVEMQMAVMDGLSNISSFNMDVLVESCNNLKQSISEYLAVNGIKMELYDFYSWARTFDAVLSMSKETVVVKDGDKSFEVPLLDCFTDKRYAQPCNGRIALNKGDREFALRNQGENDPRTGLFGFWHDAYISIRNLTPGTKLKINFGNTINLLNGSSLCLDEDPEQKPLEDNVALESERVYVVKGKPGQKVNVDLKGYHYTVVRSITVYEVKDNADRKLKKSKSRGNAKTKTSK